MRVIIIYIDDMVVYLWKINDILEVIWKRDWECKTEMINACH